MLRSAARRARLPLAPRSLCAAASNTSSSAHELPPLLLRDYLFDRLYHPRGGYFTARHAAVGALPAPLPFRHLLNRGEYISRVSAAYRDAGVSWFTPVELFQPWYARALARHILRLHGASDAPLQVYELGGGGGTCARGVLDAVAELAPEVYRRMRYTAVEVSAPLAARQAAAVGVSAAHAARFTVERRDAADVAGWGDPDDAPCFVIALEVLDNLPHDRVHQDAASSWLEARVAGVRDAPEAEQPQEAAPRGRARARALAAPTQAAPPALDDSELLREVLSPLSGASLPFPHCMRIFWSSRACLAVLRPAGGAVLGDLAAL